jgi:asparagine synthase (glutamine-hydrolysing)
MCGIVGVFGPLASECDLAEAISRLRMRGPDSQMIKRPHDFLVMGATRLAMTDPHPRSNQPLNKDGFWIVFNGEIYNHRFLRDFLTSNHGVHFNTHSDTEVLLELLRIYGPEATKMLNGMYAFAFYDDTRKRLLLARDDLGKKPLYFVKHSKRVFWSSTIEAIRTLTNNNVVNQESLIQYLAFGYSIDPNSPLEGINAVTPGTCYEFDMDLASRIHPSPKFVNLFATRPSQLRESIELAVEERIDSQREIAISLSGGLDSTIVALIASQSNAEVVAYSLRWTDSDKERYNTDFDTAKEIANRLKIRFVGVDFSTIHDVESNLKRFIDVMGEPNSNPTGVSMVPLYDVISQHRQRLVLTGDGADEIFGGYPRYESHLLRRNLRFLSESKIISMSNCNSSLRKLGLMFAYAESPLLWANFHSNFKPEEISKLLKLGERTGKTAVYESLFSVIGGVTLGEHDRLGSLALRTVMERDRRIWLVNESNRKLDRISMGFSIEARSPFQDQRVIELANVAMRTSKFSHADKSILRSLFPELKAIGIRPDKAGFISPVGHWLRNNPRIVRTGLDALAKSEIFNSSEVLRRKDDQFSGDFERIRQLWSLVVLGYWFLHIWEK